MVDTSFETNDPNVYGAGTSVKYSRKLYASLRAHKHYCSEDIGEAVFTISFELPCTTRYKLIGFNQIFHSLISLRLTTVSSDGKQ